MDSFGQLLRLTSFGESHGAALGGVLEGLPAGFAVDLQAVQDFLDRRRPGTSALVSSRREPDRVRFLSGLDAHGRTLGSPIAFTIDNVDPRSADYEEIQHYLRPSHADFTYLVKYAVEPQPGGGRSSGRETAVRCVAGAIALQWLAERFGVGVCSWLTQIGEITLPRGTEPHSDAQVYAYASRMPHPRADAAACRYLQQLRQEGDSCGGVVACRANGLPAGWGEPLYDKLPARLAYALMGINGCKGVLQGDALALAAARGSAVNDTFTATAHRITPASNHSGGTLGGISTGAPLLLTAYFKPTPSVGLPQETVDSAGRPATLQIRGRHDPCFALRAVPVVQAMTALVLADFSLRPPMKI